MLITAFIAQLLFPITDRNILVTCFSYFPTSLHAISCCSHDLDKRWPFEMRYMGFLPGCCPLRHWVKVYVYRPYFNGSRTLKITSLSFCFICPSLYWVELYVSIPASATYFKPTWVISCTSYTRNCTPPRCKDLRRSYCGKSVVSNTKRNKSSTKHENKLFP